MMGIYLKAWLQLGRVSNLPTVWSNVVHGLTVAWVVAVVRATEAQYQTTWKVSWADLSWVLDQGFMLLVGMSLLYVGGMVMNDAADAAIDAQERPARPIPSGRVSRRSAWLVSVVLLLLGWAYSFVYAPAVAWWTGALVLCIVGYNLLHRMRWVGLVLMPVCRGLVVLTAAVVVGASGAGLGLEVGWPRIAGSVLAVMCYTLIVTLIAWGEALPTMGKLARWVGVMIAGLALLDAGFVMLMGMWPMAVLCVGCAALSLIGQRFIAGS